MVETERIELSSAGCRPAVLPLNDVPTAKNGCGGGNRTHLVAAYETAVCTSSSSPQKPGRPSRNRTCDLPRIRRMHSLPCSRSMEPRARFGLSSPLYRERRSARAACGADMERVTGFEPVSGLWQSPILAARRYPHGASEGNRTLLACLEGRNSANKSHSL